MIEKLIHLSPEELVEIALGISDKDIFSDIDKNIAHNYDAFEEFVPVKTIGPWLFTNFGKKYLDGISACSAAMR